MKNNIALLAKWNLYKNNHDEYFAPNASFVYIEYISSLFKKVYLITPIHSETPPKETRKLFFKNIEIIKLPFSKGLIGAQKHFFSYYKIIKNVIPKVDLFYCRVPDPFSWLPKLIFKKKTIMHFVGDTIDATNKNKNWTWIKKKIMIAGYYPDFLLTLLAAKKSKVFTNGHHLSVKLKKYGVTATPVVSSTIKKADLKETLHDLSITNIRITYLGYLRYAKGLNTIMEVLLVLKKKNVSFIFNIIGEGEMYNEITDFLKYHQLTNQVILYGHVEDRVKINKIFDESDLFFFPSLSEGSPRVIIEAMSQGVPVISTPVGSTPFVFKDKHNIRFFDFNNVEQAVSIIEEYLNNNKKFYQLRENAFQTVKNNFTIEKFLSQIFSNN